MLSADVCHLSLSKMLLQCFPAGLAQAYSWTSLLWSDTVARLQLLCGYLSVCSSLPHFLLIALPSGPSFRPLPLSLFPRCISYTLPPTFHLHPFLSLSLSISISLLSSLRPSTILSHTLVATLKTVVTMVTAMCCGNVKELNSPRITSLFKSLNSSVLFLFDFQHLSLHSWSEFIHSSALKVRQWMIISAPFVWSWSQLLLSRVIRNTPIWNFSWPWHNWPWENSPLPSPPNVIEIDFSLVSLLRGLYNFTQWYAVGKLSPFHFSACNLDIQQLDILKMLQKLQDWHRQSLYFCSEMCVLCSLLGLILVSWGSRCLVKKWISAGGAVFFHVRKKTLFPLPNLSSAVFVFSMYF